MRILHAKSLQQQETIRVGGVCPSMNLLALVSPQAVTIYRVANLAAIAMLRLQTSATAPTRRNVPLATCLAWSPSGRLLSVGFEGGWLLTMHVETGEVVRLFTPVPRSGSERPSTHDGGCSAPMLLAETDGGVRLKLGVTRTYSLRHSVVACHWQNRAAGRHHRATPFKALEPTACLSVAAMHLTAPMLAELQRTEAVPALVVMSVQMEVSIIFAGICEVRCVLLSVPQNVSSVVGQWASSSTGSSAAPPLMANAQHVGLAAAPVRRMHITDGADLMFVVRTAQNTERLFCAPLGPRNWTDILNADRVLACVAVHEYVSVAQAAVAQCATRWSSCMDHVFSECRLSTPTASTATSNTARQPLENTATILRTMLLTPLCLQDKVSVDAVLAKLSIPKLLLALASVRSGFASLLSRMHDEAIVPLEAAQQLASAVVDASDPLYVAIGAATLRSEEFIVFARREGDNVATLIRWLLQLMYKRAQDDTAAAGTVPPGVAQPPVNQGQPGLNTPASGFEPLRVEEHPTVLRTLHRIVHGTTTTGGVMQTTTVADLSDAFAHWQAEGMRLLPVHALLSRGCQEAIDVFDVSSRYLAQPLASSVTPSASFISIEPCVDGSNDGDDADGGAVPVLRLFHVRESLDGSAIGTPLVAAWAVHGNDGRRCVLESGPAPVGLHALLNASGSDGGCGADVASGVVGHAHVSDRHLIVAARGTSGVAVGLFEQNGECAMFESDADTTQGGDGEDGGGKMAHDALLIDGLTASSAKPVELSVSGARGYGVLYNAERFMLLQFDCL